jgi:hypothetical protein
LRDDTRAFPSQANARRKGDVVRTATPGGDQFPGVLRPSIP